MRTIRTALTVAALMAMAGAGAEAVYRSVDADGAVSFSDVPQPGAQRIALSVSSRSAEDLAEAHRETDRILTIAERLAEGRLERERLRLARATRLAELALLEEQVRQPAIPARQAGAWPWGQRALAPVTAPVVGVGPAPFSRFAPAFSPYPPAFEP